MRLILVCEMAITFPTTMVRAARPHSTGTRSSVEGGEGSDEDAQQGGKPGCLGADRHETGHRGGGTLVDIRRPHVERDGRDLEAEADQDQGRADGQQERITAGPEPEPATAETIPAREVVPVAPKTRAMP